MKKKNYGQSLHVLNFISWLFIFAISFVLILYVFNDISIFAKTISIIISGIVVIIFALVIKCLIIKKYKYSWVRSLNKRYNDENMSYNLYKIDPFLEEKGLTEYQWHALMRLRILNLFLFIITSVCLILAIIDFSGLLFHDIILPIIMLISVTGICFVFIDFLEEIIIRKYYHKHQKTYDNLEYVKKISFLSKNYRIYYVPICIFIGIIIILIVANTKNDLSKIVRLSLLIVLIDIIFMILVDFLISKTFKFFKFLYEESKGTIDDDIFDDIEDRIEKEKESDRDEIQR